MSIGNIKRSHLQDKSFEGGGGGLVARKNYGVQVLVLFICWYHNHI